MILIKEIGTLAVNMKLFGSWDWPVYYVLHRKCHTESTHTINCVF